MGQATRPTSSEPAFRKTGFTAVAGFMGGRLVGAAAGKLVGPFVLGMSRVAFDPEPLHVVALSRGIEPLPEIGILDRLFLLGHPAIAFPLEQPLGDASAQVLARTSTSAGPSCPKASRNAGSSWSALSTCGCRRRR
jgi:hypothetical protein